MESIIVTLEEACRKNAEGVLPIFAYFEKNVQKRRLSELRQLISLYPKVSSHILEKGVSLIKYNYKN